MRAKSSPKKGARKNVVQYQKRLWEPLNKKSGAETQNRTGDTRIFSPLLYHLSYLGTEDWLPIGLCGFRVSGSDAIAYADQAF